MVVAPGPKHYARASKEIFLPLPTVIKVAAAKSCLSVLLHGMSGQPHIFCSTVLHPTRATAAMVSMLLQISLD
jgi:hypothetical protein